MSGNVFEWTCSKFRQNYSEATKCSDDFSSDTDRVMRGGSHFWGTLGNFGMARSAHREIRDAGTRRRDFGFRLVTTHPEGGIINMRSADPIRRIFSFKTTFQIQIKRLVAFTQAGRRLKLTTPKIVTVFLWPFTSSTL